MKRRLADAAPSLEEADDGNDWDGDPVFLSPEEIDGLKAADLPSNVYVQVGQLRGTVHHIDFEGTLARGTKTPLRVVMTPSWYRKHWPLPLGMGQYVDLVRRAIETRQRTRGDVELGEFDGEDDPCDPQRYTIHLETDDLALAYDEAKRISAELSEAADVVCAQDRDRGG